MPSNFANQTMWTGDNLPILRGVNSASVDLIYLDPPFNSKANYAAPIGSQAAGAAFKDTWGLSDVDAEWINLIEAKHPAGFRVLLAAMTDGDKGYLAYMAARLLELRCVLKPTGSIYLHCDPTMSHYLKLLMDAVWGRQQFRTEIVWKWTGAHSDRRQGRAQHGRVHDVLLFYTKSDAWTWNLVYTNYDPEYIRRSYRHTEEGTGRRYRLENLTGPGGAAKGNLLFCIDRLSVLAARVSLMSLVGETQAMEAKVKTQTLDLGLASQRWLNVSAAITGVSMRGYCQTAINRELSKDEANGLGGLPSAKSDYELFAELRHEVLGGMENAADLIREAREIRYAQADEWA